MLENCQPVDGHCARYPAVRIHDAGVCRRCRQTRGASMARAAAGPGAPPPNRRTNCPHRGQVIAYRPCETCQGKNVRLKVYACALHAGGVTLMECQTCTRSSSS